ncbi:MAG: vWA domain-containing protein [Gemmataceae bacterium]
MPFVAEISRTNPTCFVFLIDQSGSMKEPFGGSGRVKAQGVADAVNRLLDTIVQRCAKGETVQNRFHVGVIGYGAKTGPAFGGTLAGKGLPTISEVACHPLRLEQRTKVVHVDDGAGGVIESKQTVKFPIWFEPQAGGLTPMCAALDQAWNLVSEFIVEHPSCYPPLVINITDGEASDGNPEPHAEMIQQLASNDGNVLLFNVHISSNKAAKIEFPDAPESLPDDYARLLFRMSSKLPPLMLGMAQSEGYAVSESTRGFVFNADLVSLIRFLDIGTRVGVKNQR